MIRGLRAKINPIDEACNISVNHLKRIIESVFRSGMLYGYGVNHEDIENDQDKAWEEYIKSNKEIKEIFDRRNNNEL